MRTSFLCSAPCSCSSFYPALRRRYTASLFSCRANTLPAPLLPPHLGFIGLEYSHGRMDSAGGTYCSGEASNSSNSSKASTWSYEKSYHANTFREGGSEGANYQNEKNRETHKEERQRSSKSTSAEEEECHSENAHFGAGGSKMHRSGTVTSRERLGITKKWENAFFGRNQYEQGMRERFREAVSNEAQDEPIRKQHEALFPRWPEDEETPFEEFREVPATLQLRYIINRLTMGERRIRYAVDYGSLSMMYQLNLGELMLRDAERLLSKLDWLNDDVRERIADLKAIALRLKYDYDLD